MAVSTSYALQNIKPEFIVRKAENGVTNSDERDPSLVALADGGFAIAYEWQFLDIPTQTSMFLERYTIDGTFRPTVDDNPPGVSPINSFFDSEGNVDPAITQLIDGRILTTWTQTAGTGAGIRYAIVDPANGAVTREDTLLPGTDANDFFSDVVALAGGGFALVKQETSSSTDEDVDLLIYNAAGALVTSRALGANSSFDEQDPAVAVLTNGNIVVAYEKEKTDGGNTFGMAVEIFTAAGMTVLAPFTFDTGGDQNRAPDVVALQDGGFAVVYQDDGYGQPGLSIAFFTAAGALRDIKRVDSSATADLDPSVTVLANGFVAVTRTHALAGDNDIYSALFDPASMARLVSSSAIETQTGNQGDSSTVGLANGTFVTAWTDANNTVHVDGNTDPNGTHVSLQIDAYVRTSVGDGAPDTFVGDQLRDIIQAGGGNDRLDGGAGADNMTGGTGDDTFHVDVAGDQVFEANGEGTDRVFAGASYTLAAGQSIETLSTLSDVSTTAINLTGNEIVNVLIGNDGVNRLDGRGAADVMAGYGGSDWYFVDVAGDKVVFEGASDGNDRVFAGVSYTLAATQRIETLSTTSDTGTGAINLTGNEIVNVLIGNDGVNRLDGRGGADVMAGYGGDDWYFVDVAGDKVVFEGVSDGIDRVFAGVSYTLAATQRIETLSTLSDVGTGAINLTGNEFANTLIGNDGVNRFDGRGGADVMAGYGGDDWYFVDVAGDKVVFEGASDGNDRVFAGVSYTLAATQRIETLSTLSDISTTAINLTGNEFANTLIGNAGANVLNGGAGADVLASYGGNDIFLFNTAIGPSNIDTLYDFVVANDTVHLENAIFTQLTTPAGNTLSAAQFFTGAAAHDADDRIIYNSATGALFYDSDGNGAAVAIQFAKAGTGLALTNADFFVV